MQNGCDSGRTGNQSCLIRGQSARHAMGVAVPSGLVSSQPRPGRTPGAHGPGSVSSVNSSQGQPRAPLFKTTVPGCETALFWGSLGDSDHSKLEDQRSQETSIRALGHRVWESCSLFTLTFWFLGKGYQRFKFLFSKQKTFPPKTKRMKVSHRPRCNKATPPFLQSLSCVSGLRYHKCSLWWVSQASLVGKVVAICCNELVINNRKGPKGRPDVRDVSFGQLHQEAGISYFPGNHRPFPRHWEGAQPRETARVQWS